ncbi:TPA: hypothetical protein ACNRZR_005285, partial [Escherichia coli]
MALLVISFLFNNVMGVEVDSFRRSVNELRLDGNVENAKTMILPFFDSGGVFWGWINVVLTWITMMLPLPLFLTFSPLYLILFLLITMLWSLFWKSVSKSFKSKDKTLRAVIALILSFSALQSIFEPDYGSYVRHLSPLYPLFFYIYFLS